MQTMFNDLLNIIKLSFQEKIFRKMFGMQILDNLFLFDLISVIIVGRSETTIPLKLRKKMDVRLPGFPLCHRGHLSLCKCFSTKNKGCTSQSSGNNEFRNNLHLGILNEGILRNNKTQNNQQNQNKYFAIDCKMTICVSNSTLLILYYIALQRHDHAFQTLPPYCHLQLSKGLKFTIR